LIDIANHALDINMYDYECELMRDVFVCDIFQTGVFAEWLGL